MKTSVSISHVLLSLSPSVSEKKTLVCLASTSHRQQLGKDKTEEKLKKIKINKTQHTISLEISGLSGDLKLLLPCFM